MADNSIAVLMTCHNRIDKTRECLLKLYQNISKNEIDIYLVDDGSTDSTSQVISNEFPEIQLIRGNGHLYWNGGMRLAWETAYLAGDYDFYIWLNNDTFLYGDAINALLDAYKKGIKNGNDSIITGACEEKKHSGRFSYGGKMNDVPCIPDGTIHECNIINGNVVLVPKNIFQKIGNLADVYTHGMGDYDYGLRALEAGFNCYSTDRYIAECSRNTTPSWKNPKLSVFQRIRALNDPTGGLYLKEYVIFRKRHWGNRWIIDLVKVLLKSLFPRAAERYNKFIN